MRICYCEDEIAQAKLLKKQVENWAGINNVNIHMELFESAEEFLFKAEQFDYDLIFLDISMNKMNGMELAKKIRETDEKVVLVFITSDQSFVFDGYEVGAYRYLLKPIVEKKLYEILSYVECNLREKTVDDMVIKIKNENVRIAFDEILYLEVQGHYVKIHRDSAETLSIKVSFSELLKTINQYKEKCVLAHRSYAVNIVKISRIGRTECTLVNGEKIPISRSAYKGLNDAFIKYNLEGKEFYG